MRANKLKTLTKDYRTFLPQDWLLNQKEFVRLHDDWVQIISLNPSSYNDEYVPRCSFDFLLMPGPALGSFLVQELKETRFPVQKWVSLKQHQKGLPEIFKEMVKQFKPPIVKPFRGSDVVKLLKNDLDYWPHPYALCVLASKESNKKKANLYFNAFCEAVSDKPYDWVKQRKEDLAFCLKIMNNPQKLQEYFASCRNQKLSSFRVFNQCS